MTVDDEAQPATSLFAWTNLPTIKGPPPIYHITELPVLLPLPCGSKPPTATWRRILHWPFSRAHSRPQERKNSSQKKYFCVLSTSNQRPHPKQQAQPPQTHATLVNVPVHKDNWQNGNRPGNQGPCLPNRRERCKFTTFPKANRNGQSSNRCGGCGVVTYERSLG